MATRRIFVPLLTILMILSLMPAASAAGRSRGGDTTTGPVDLTGEINGAPYEIRVPENWNGTLLVYAHGYRDKFDHPLDTTDRTAPGGSDAESAPGGDLFEDALLAMGYALAGSLYSDDGWAVREGIRDTRRLVREFNLKIGRPTTTILWGFSMGSLVTMNLAEHSRAFDGYIPACAVGAGASAAWDVGLTLPVAYTAAFGWPEAWGEVGNLPDFLDFEQNVFGVIAGQLADPTNLGLFEFMRIVSDLPAGQFYTNWLFTDMFFATEARAELERRAGGPAASNVGHTYTVEPAEQAYLESLGVDVDGLLAEMNSVVIRSAPRADGYLRQYSDYTGRIRKPVLTLHTELDGLVPVEHEAAYASIVDQAGRSRLLHQVYVSGEGHCTFSPEQLVTVVKAMEFWITTGTKPPAAFFDPGLGFLPDFEPAPWPQPL